MSATVSYARFTPTGTYDAIVVGSGIGGLTAAAMLARHGGRRVLVLERHTVAGGFTHVFHRGRYEWDTGVHYVGGANREGSRERAVFDHVTEGRLSWQAMPERFERFRFGDREFAVPAGREAFREALLGWFPGERRAIDGYLRAIRTATHRADLHFAAKVLPGPVDKVLGGLLRYPFWRCARELTAAPLQRLTADPLLRALFAAQWADYGLPPGESSFGAHAMVAMHFLDGAAYPVGGASRIAASIAPGIERAGGSLVTGAEVASILVERGRAVGVRMADGRELRAKAVVSDAGARNTWQHLLPEGSPGRAEALAELGDVPPSVAHLCLYAGLRSEDPGEFGAANLWLFPDADHDGNYRRFLADEAAPLPGVFVSFPAAKDPDFAARHPGRSTIQLLVPAAFAQCSRWQDRPWQRRGEDYGAWKARWTERLLAELDRAVPGARARVETAEVSTPLSTRHFSAHPHGEIYGLAHTPRRFRLRCLGARTTVRDLWLTGQDIVVAGVTGALIGGLLTASAMLRRNLVGRARKGV